jgi:hypothetical protein
VQISMALETIDVSLLVAQLRKVLRKWKAETWPDAFERESTASRLFRSLTSGFSDRNQLSRVPARPALVLAEDDSENGEIRSQFSFASQSSNKLGWLALAMRSGN